MRRLYPSTVRLTFSANADFAAAVAAINQGAVHRFLQKPLRARELREVVVQAFEERSGSDSSRWSEESLLV